MGHPGQQLFDERIRVSRQNPPTGVGERWAAVVILGGFSVLGGKRPGFVERSGRGRSRCTRVRGPTLGWRVFSNSIRAAVMSLLVRRRAG